ncbi:Serine/threonine-protein kinase mTOR, partial [Fragariocoptes setiger]
MVERTNVLATIFNNLRSKNDDERIRAAQQLWHHVINEVHGKPIEVVKKFIEDINQQIYQLLQANTDINDKKGGCLAIITLISVDVGDRNTQCSRFANILRNLPVTTDPKLMELEALAIGKIASASGSLTASYVEYEVSRAIEWLRTDQGAKKHGAVLKLRELANAAPSFFTQHIQQFFDSIFLAICDSELTVRESGVDALRSALYVLVSRETKETQNPKWYRHCYEEAMKNLSESSSNQGHSGSGKRARHEDKMHGSLLVLCELFRYSNAEAERIFQAIDDNVLSQASYDQHHHAYLTSNGTTLSCSASGGPQGGRASSASVNNIMFHSKMSPSSRASIQSAIGAPSNMSVTPSPSIVPFATTSAPPVAQSHRTTPFKDLALFAKSFRHPRRQSQPTSSSGQQHNLFSISSSGQSSAAVAASSTAAAAVAVASHHNQFHHHVHRFSPVPATTMHLSGTTPLLAMASPGSLLVGGGASAAVNQSLSLSSQTSPTLRRTICESPTCREFLDENFPLICDLVMRQNSTRIKCINRVLLILIPRLAAFKPKYFIENHLSQTVNMLLNGLAINRSSSSLTPNSLSSTNSGSNTGSSSSGVTSSTHHIHHHHSASSLSASHRERPMYFISIGLLAFGVREALEPYIPRIMDAISACLPASHAKDGSAIHHNITGSGGSGSGSVHGSKKRNAQAAILASSVEPSVFICINLLAQALGQLIEPEIRSQNILDQMTLTGLSPTLAAAFLELSIQMPQLRKQVHSHLLEMLSLVLMQRPFSHPGAPGSGVNQGMSNSASGGTLDATTGQLSPVNHHSYMSHHHHHMQHGKQADDVGSITLALRILSRFDFHSMFTMQFATHCADTYLVSEIREIRLEAVKTCCQLLLPAIIRNQNKHSPSLVDAIQNVLHKLLVAGVTDSEPEVRYFVLASLSPKFDPYLAQVTNLNCLFLCLNEEIFEIRELAICIIGRLSSLNPGFVLPSLRKVLLNYLNELKYSGMGRNKEQAARMLAQLFAHAPALMRSYTEPIINEFLAQLRDAQEPTNAQATISVLAAVGQQAQVSGTDLLAYVHKLVPVLLDSIQDSTSELKRDIGLWTLGHLIENTGFVVEPYWMYPNMLDILLNLLKTEQAPSIRIKAIRVLGLLGAIDPYRHQVNLGQIDQAGEMLSSQPSDSPGDGQTGGGAGATAGQGGGTGVTSTNIAGGTGPGVGQPSASEMLVNLSNSYDDFYPAIAISALIKIMRDSSLIHHHTMAVQAVTFIFQRLGVRCVQYIQDVLPSFISVIHQADSQYIEFFFQQLGNLVSIVKQHIRNYLDDIFELIKKSWSAPNPLPNLQITLINLVEQIVVAPDGEFRVYLPRLIPHALKVFQYDRSPKCMVTERLLHALQEFGNNLDDCLYLILPPVVKCFDSIDMPLQVRKTALETIEIFAETLDISEFATRIIHPLIRVLDYEPELRPHAMDALSAMAQQLGQTFALFVPTVHKVMSKHKIVHTPYDIVESRLFPSSGLRASRSANGICGVSNNDVIDGYSPGNLSSLSGASPGGGAALRRRVARDKSGAAPTVPPDLGGTSKKVQVSDLQRAWSIRRRASRDDWLEWLRILSIDLLKESPSLALKSCNPLAQAYYPLSRELFNPAFLCCWTELTPEQQHELIGSIELALTAQDVPEVTQALLNLTEFMEHSDRGPLPIKPRLLAQRAQMCRAFAKALHYTEEEFRQAHSGSGPTGETPNSSPSSSSSIEQPKDKNNKLPSQPEAQKSTQVLEDLLSINNQLHQHEAAAGVLKYAENNGFTLINKEGWYEKLRDWDAALAEYTAKLNLDMSPSSAGNQQQRTLDVQSVKGLLRCYENIGEWDSLYKLATDTWPQFGEPDRQEVAKVAASAAWALRKWDGMTRFTSAIKDNTVDSAFYKAVLAVHRDQFDEAMQLIDVARTSIDTDLTAMAGESKSRAYGAMVQVMMLAELEEVIAYKQAAGDEQTRAFIRDKWWKRLKGCDQIVEDWQRILTLRSLVITPQDDMRAWIKFASLCQRTSNSQCRLAQSHRILTMLLAPNSTPTHGHRSSLMQQRISTSVNPSSLASSPTSLTSTVGDLTLHGSSYNQQFEQTIQDEIDDEQLCERPQVAYAYLKHLWRAGHRHRAFARLDRFVERAPAKLVGMSGLNLNLNLNMHPSPSIGSFVTGLSGSTPAVSTMGPPACSTRLGQTHLSPTNSSLAQNSSNPKPALDLNVLLSKCYLKLGQWQESLQGVNEDSIDSIHHYYHKATEHDCDSYKAWHALAYMAYEAVLFYARSASPASGDTSPSPSDALSTTLPPGQLTPPVPEVGGRFQGGSSDTQPAGTSYEEESLVSPRMSEVATPLTATSSLAPDTPTPPTSNNFAGNCQPPTMAVSLHSVGPLELGDKQEQQPERRRHHLQQKNASLYTVTAIHAFFRSISLSHGNSLQDTLRLLTLWFDVANDTQVSKAFGAGIKSVPTETWLKVIPQLIARVDSPRPNVNLPLQELLSEIGKQHPQALIYPLTVASKSTVVARQRAAKRLMSSMREHSSQLVAQAMLVSEELIRVAILWHELWHEALEEASRLYFGEKNIKGMLETLEPLHEMMARGAQTLKEMSFQHAYGRDLLQAYDWCTQFQRSGNTRDLTQAWHLYYNVFRRISKQLPQLTLLELKYVSPKLEVCHDLELAVPGSYTPCRPVVQIARVESNLQVITSKQRPRKLCIRGSDGKTYTFLLKGHEDLRQDERVMQLFSLVNTLLVSHAETARSNLTIQRYSVIPLSTNSGLIGWVPHCDTLHTLIKDYREKRKVILNIEHRLMLKMAPDYDHLTLMQKVEVFEHALANTFGDDLAKLLWLKSPSSEVWFDRRTNYTRSLATMSMVGYVLGLGDRHPSNLMLDRLSGKILHIDFGDCFEVAMTREKFPEKIPFRLTRMLINAMEVTGIEGTYRMTCEKMMHVLRKNKDSLMAVLEAFVYDPLLNWRQDEREQPAANAKALAVVNRVRDKLTGRDFDPCVTLDVPKQIDLLIKQATSHENLCQCYIGWCPFW